MLAQITVTSLQDNLTSDGLITLREAIVAANTDSIADAMEGMQAGSGADTIVFAQSLFSMGPQTLMLAFDTDSDTLADQFDISSDITIVGPGPDRLTIDANDGDPTPDSTRRDDPGFDGDGTSIFVIGGSTENFVSISGLALTGADSPSFGAGVPSGGAIHSSGVNLTLNDLWLYDNHGPTGGGIFAGASGDNVVTISNSIIGHDNPEMGNSAETGGGIAIVVLNDADVLLTGLQIRGNATLVGRGGGVHLQNGDIGDTPGNFTLQDSLVSGNTEILSIVVDEEFCQAATSWDLTPSLN
jgi:hypothetical protein